MILYIVRRLGATLLVMAVVAFFVFSLLFLTPGDPAAVIAGDVATDQDIKNIRAKLGLDEPFLVQFGGWVWRLLHGDLGTSIFTNLPVTTLIGQRVQPTVSLTLCTLVVAVLIAVPLGVLAAARAGSWIDRLVMGFSVLGFSVPVFVLAYMLIYGASIVGLTLVMLLSGLDLVTAFSAVIVCVNNIGPGLGAVGPASHFGVLNDFQLWILSLAMLLGRLELLSVLVLLTPQFWRK